jgi:hypothetical protein
MGTGLGDCLDWRVGVEEHTARSRRLKYPSSLDVNMGMHSDGSTKSPWPRGTVRDFLGRGRAVVGGSYFGSSKSLNESECSGGED